jgi:polyphosphate kinase
VAAKGAVTRLAAATGARKGLAAATGTRGTVLVAADTPPSSTTGDRFLNRDLSWLDFNSRVLELASDDEVPLLERVTLFAIVASNLDEFFAVRVARLEHAVALGSVRPLPDGRTQQETLIDARQVTVGLLAAQDRAWLDGLRPALAAEGIRVVSLEECSARELRSLRKHFRREIEPVLSSTVLDVRTAPEIPSLELNVAAIVCEGKAPERRVVRVGVPDSLPRFVQLRKAGGLVPLEDVILRFLPAVVGAGAIEASGVFRVTRDANLVVGRDDDDGVKAGEAALLHRPFGDIVRLEIGAGASPALVAALTEELGLDEAQCYESEAPLALRGLLELADADRPELKSAAWQPVTHGAFAGGDTGALLAEIRRGDVLVHHPYDSFESSVQAFVSAADDPWVAALKATVYRTGDASPTLASLVQAATVGKSAEAFVEVRARFDERRNIDSGRALEEAGVDVVYGVPHVKVHAKLTLLERRERDGVRRYVHVGTGNYHASNACGYEDLSLFTADADVAADVAEVFDVITGRAQVPVFRKLLVGPWYLRGGILDEIERVARAAMAGLPGRIRIKVNSLADPGIVDALYRASQAGATVEVVTRGICTLRPGMSGVSDRIRVRSVLGRFLEHSRILAFETDERSTTWIGSADLMPRNLDHRIEVLVPVEDDRLQFQLHGIFDALLDDTASSWDLDASGAWHRALPDGGVSPISAQQTLMTRAARNGAPAPGE